MALSLQQFIDQVAGSSLMSAKDIAAVIGELPLPQRPSDAEQLARLLVKEKRLTAYQVQQCFAGKGKSLVLGNYILLDKLGQGGMGMVLKAQHKRMKRIVALKVLAPNVAKDAALIARFHREVEAAARLAHPNIVAAYDADEANHTSFLVMEYVEGTDLSSLVKKKGPLPIEQAIQCILQAAKGLEYAHKQGVIHRDIKPANLLLDREGVVKILDMGLARIEGETAGKAELTSTGAVMGTVDYMAPEQALSTKHADARSDIYSLGIALWYLVKACPAYDGDSLMARLLAHRESPIPSLIPQNAPANSAIVKWTALDAVFRKMVAKKSEDRYQSMTEVVAALEACQRGDAAAPQMTIGPSEDSRLDQFLAKLDTGPARSDATLAAPVVSPTAVTKPLDAADSFEKTINASDSDVPTDPQTLTSLPSKVAAAKGRGSATGAKVASSGAWWRDRRVQFAAAAAIVILLLTITFRGASEQTSPAVPNTNAETAAAVPAAGPAASQVGRRPNDASIARADTGENTVPSVSPPAAAVNWIPLFDGGSNTSAWETLGPFKVESGLLVADGGGGNAISKDDYADFELEAEWRVGPQGNSGIYYREPPTTAIGPGNEYQMLDDAAYADKQPPLMQTGSLYGLIAPSATAAKPIGEWNQTRIICRGTRVEHWLNGQQVVQYDTASDTWKQLVTASTFGGKDRIGLYPTGRILLQGHTGEVAFRSIRIRRLHDAVTAPSSAAGMASGSALNFDGVDDHVVVESLNLADYPPDQPLTIEATVRPIDSKISNVVSWLGDNWLALFTMNGRWGLGRLLEGPRMVSGSQPTPLGQTVRVAGVWNNRQWTLYIDGQRQELRPVNFNIVPTSGGLYLGGVPLDKLTGHTEGRWFGGEIEEVRISRTARYSGENYPIVEQFTPDADTIALYHFAEGSGDVLFDSSGHGHDGRIVGATWEKTRDSTSTQPGSPRSSQQLRQGLRFDGHSYVLVPTVKSTPVTPFTLEALVSMEAVRTDQHYAAVACIGHVGSMGYFYNSPSSGLWTSSVLQKGDQLSTGEWTDSPTSDSTNRLAHIAMTWNAGELRFFLDGHRYSEVRKFDISPNALLSDGLVLGAEGSIADRATSGFVGILHGVRLSRGRIYEQEFRPPTSLTADSATELLFDFSQGSGDFVKDVSGHGHDGKIFGATWVRIEPKLGPQLGNDPPFRDAAQSQPIPALAPLAGKASLVSRPRFISGLKSWDISRRTPAGTVCGAGFLPDGRLVTNWEQSDGVYVHGANLKVEQIFLGHSVSGSSGFALHRERRLAATYARDGRLIIRDLDTGKVRLDRSVEWTSSRLLAFNRDGSRLASLTESAVGVFVVPAEGQTAVSEPVWTGFVPKVAPRCLLWSPDESQIWTLDANYVFRAFSADTCRPVPTHPLQGQAIAFMQLSPDRRFVVTASPTGAVQVSNATDWSRVAGWELANKLPAGAIAWSPDATQLAFAVGSQVEVWTVENPTRLMTQDAFAKELIWHTDGLLALNHHESSVRIDVANRRSQPLPFAPNRIHHRIDDEPFGTDRIVTGGWGHTLVTDLESGAAVSSFYLAPNDAAPAISPSGQLVAIRLHRDLRTTIFDAESKERVVDLPYGIQAAWTPDDSRIAIMQKGSDNTCNCLIHDATTGEELQRFNFAGGSRETLCWSPDGEHLAVRVVPDSALHVWNCRTMSLRTLRPTERSAAEDRNSPFCSPRWQSASVVLAPFGNALLEFDLNQPDASSIRTRIPAEPFRSIRAFDIHPETQRIVDMDLNYVRIGDRNGEPAQRMDWHGLQEPPRWLPDGRRIVTFPFSYYDIPARGFDAETFGFLGTHYPFVGQSGWLTIGPTGHFRGSEGIESEILYVAEHLDGHQQTYTAEEFATAFHWRNDPQQATFLKLVETARVFPTTEPMPTRVGDMMSRSIEFTAPDARVEVPNIRIDLTQPWTIESWLQLDTGNHEGMRVAAKFGPIFLTTYHGHWQLLAAHTDSVGNGEWGVAINGPSIHDQPTHIAAQWTGVDLELYVDGSPVSAEFFRWGTTDSPEEILRKLFTVPGQRTMILGNLEYERRNVLGGRMAALKFSNHAKYSGIFTPQPITKTADTLALYDFSQGSGDVLKDVSGHGHDGKIVGATWVSRQQAPPAEVTTGALSFDGVDDYVVIPSLKFPELPFTLECWTTPPSMPLPGVAPTSDLEEFGIAGWPYAGRLVMFTTNRTNPAFATQIHYPEGKGVPTIFGKPNSFEGRHHLALVATKDQLTFYVDGVPQGQRDLGTVHTSSSHGSSFGIGADVLPDQPLHFYSGSLHSLRLSGRDLYDAEFSPCELTADADTLALYDFSQGSGDVLKDVSGHGHDGKIVGATWVRAADPIAAASRPLAAPAGGFALQFDGDRSLVELPPLDHDGGPLTIEARVLMGPQRDKPRHLVRVASPARSFGLWGSPRHVGLTVRDANQTQISQTPWDEIDPSLPLDVAAVWDGQQARLFINGRMVPTTPEVEPADADRLKDAMAAEFSIGWSSVARATGAPAFDGRIDEVRISKTARYVADYTVPPRLETDEQTLALYHCDEGQGTVLHDASGHGRDGNIIGATWIPRPDTAPTASRDREIAEWAIGQGGGVFWDGAPRYMITDVAQLPAEPFSVRALYFVNVPVTAEDLQRMAQLPGLWKLALHDSGTTDAGLRHFQAHPQLNEVQVFKCPVTDQSIPLLASLPSLKSVNLSSTQITAAGIRELARLRPAINKWHLVGNKDVDDATLQILAALPSLLELDVRSTAVTKAGVEAIRKAHPQVKLQSDL